jgi:uncharacterized membrane protein
MTREQPPHGGDGKDPAAKQEPSPTKDTQIEVDLPVQKAYALFCDVSRTPEWMSEVRSARIAEYTEEGLPLEAVYMASMARGGLVYKVRYTYDTKEYEVTWESADINVRRLEGSAKFLPLGAERCRMIYRSHARVGGEVTSWLGEKYQDRPQRQLAESFQKWAEKQGSLKS